MNVKILARRSTRIKNYSSFVRKKPKILIIGNSPQDDALLMRQLKRADLDEHVGIINNGPRALAYLTDDRLDCKNLSAVFLDLNLPRFKGIRLLEVIRMNEGLRNVPVVILTSPHSSEDLEPCRKLGASSFVQKPLTFSSFAKAFADTFHARRAHVQTGLLTIE